MLHLPSVIIDILDQFAPLFSRRVWEKMKVLITGFILAPSDRTVAAALRVVGLGDYKHFENYHRVLNRDRWSPLGFARVLLKLLVCVFVPSGEPVVVGMDETIERRRGEMISAKGIYRDPVRSSKEFFVKTSGLRWVSMMLLTHVPWAQRVWALPFFTVLAPSERYHERRELRHKKLTDWGRQMILQLRRWLPDRYLVVVTDSTYSVVELVARCVKIAVTLVSRLRMDAALYEPAPPRLPGTKGRSRKKGKREPTLKQRLADPQTNWDGISVPWYGGEERVIEVATGTAIWYHSGMSPAPIRWVIIRDPSGEFEPQALLCTDQDALPDQIVSWFILRWRMEVTFHEARTHLGMETQRQWSDKAISRTTPLILSLFSLVTLFAHHLHQDQPLAVRRTAWYDKKLPTFSDTIAFVRHNLWPSTLFSMSSGKPDIEKMTQELLHRMIDTLAYAA